MYQKKFAPILIPTKLVSAWTKSVITVCEPLQNVVNIRNIVLLSDFEDWLDLFEMSWKLYTTKILRDSSVFTVYVISIVLAV